MFLVFLFSHFLCKFRSFCDNGKEKNWIFVIFLTALSHMFLFWFWRVFWNHKHVGQTHNLEMIELWNYIILWHLALQIRHWKIWCLRSFPFLFLSFFFSFFLTSYLFHFSPFFFFSSPCHSIFILYPFLLPFFSFLFSLFPIPSLFLFSPRFPFLSSIFIIYLCFLHFFLCRTSLVVQFVCIFLGSGTGRGQSPVVL